MSKLLNWLFPWRKRYFLLIEVMYEYLKIQGGDEYASSTIEFIKEDIEQAIGKKP